MCITISIEVPSIKKYEFESFVSKQAGSKKLELQFQDKASGPETFRFLLSEVGEGCACSMLTDNADWNAPSWDFQAELLGDLECAFESICRQASNGFAVEALWAGDKPKKVLKVSCNELRKLVRENSISTSAR